LYVERMSSPGAVTVTKLPVSENGALRSSASLAATATTPGNAAG
jgi:hypothetical protein